MIQDILPLHLQNQYEKKQPDDTSYMMIYRENKILVREGETLAFLTYRELREICETAGEMAPQSIYLFSVGEETYFLTELPEHLTPEGYCFEKMFAVRSESRRSTSLRLPRHGICTSGIGITGSAEDADRNSCTTERCGCYSVPHAATRCSQRSHRR